MFQKTEVVFWTVVIAHLQLLVNRRLVGASGLRLALRRAAYTHSAPWCHLLHSLPPVHARPESSVRHGAGRAGGTSERAGNR